MLGCSVPAVTNGQRRAVRRHADVGLVFPPGTHGGINQNRNALTPTDLGTSDTISQPNRGNDVVRSVETLGHRGRQQLGTVQAKWWSLDVALASSTDLAESIKVRPDTLHTPPTPNLHDTDARRPLRLLRLQGLPLAG